MGDVVYFLLSKSSSQISTCSFCFPQISTKMCFVFVLGTKNSSGHVQTNFFFRKVPNVLEKFPTFGVDVIPSPLSSYGVATLFPLPISISACVDCKWQLHQSGTIHKWCHTFVILEQTLKNWECAIKILICLIVIKAICLLILSDL